jgi:hypothetical protein
VWRDWWPPAVSSRSLRDDSELGKVGTDRIDHGTRVPVGGAVRSIKCGHGAPHRLCAATRLAGLTMRIRRLLNYPKFKGEFRDSDAPVSWLLEQYEQYEGLLRPRWS